VLHFIAPLRNYSLTHFTVSVETKLLR